MDVRIKTFQEATATFTYLAQLDLAELKKKLEDDRLVDGMQNGCAQKFEYATELCWKAIMMAHTMGVPFHLDAVMDLVKKHNLWLIEDNCDAWAPSTPRKTLKCKTPKNA
jgi:dTDP-4-amino-4,6-dideoxygalactose transaminase